MDRGAPEPPHLGIIPALQAISKTLEESNEELVRSMETFSPRQVAGQVAAIGTPPPRFESWPSPTMRTGESGTSEIDAASRGDGGEVTMQDVYLSIESIRIPLVPSQTLDSPQGAGAYVTTASTSGSKPNLTRSKGKRPDGSGRKTSFPLNAPPVEPKGPDLSVPRALRALGVPDLMFQQCSSKLVPLRRIGVELTPLKLGLM